MMVKSLFTIMLMETLTNTTRELILDKIDKNKEEIALLKFVIEKNKQSIHLKQMNFLEIDILKGNNERLRKVLIENVFEEIN